MAPITASATVSPSNARWSVPAIDRRWKPVCPATYHRRVDLVGAGCARCSRPGRRRDRLSRCWRLSPSCSWGRRLGGLGSLGQLFSGPVSSGRGGRSPGAQLTDARVAPSTIVASRSRPRHGAGRCARREKTAGPASAPARPDHADRAPRVEWRRRRSRRRHRRRLPRPTNPEERTQPVRTCSTRRGSCAGGGRQGHRKTGRR